MQEAKPYNRLADIYHNFSFPNRHNYIDLFEIYNRPFIVNDQFCIFDPLNKKIFFDMSNDKIITDINIIILIKAICILSSSSNG
jgi:hypothetical protein